MKNKISKAAIADRNEMARDWLKRHDLINHAKLSRRIQYDRSNFWHFMDGQKDLNEDVIIRLEAVLESYGYS